MSTLMRWISILRASVRAEPAGTGSFEYIDAASLSATDFRASATMQLDGPTLLDFSETLPAIAPRAAPEDEKTVPTIRLARAA
jgi:hypothetical protein